MSDNGDNREASNETGNIDPETLKPSSHQRSSSEASCNSTTTSSPLQSSLSSITNNDHPRMVEAGCRLPSNARRKFRTLTFGRHYNKTSGGNSGGSGGTSGASKDGLKKKRKTPWTFRFNYRLRRGQSTSKSTNISDDTSDGSAACVCTGYRRTEEPHLNAGTVLNGPTEETAGVTDWLATYNNRSFDEYPIEDCEDRARAARARELEEGVDPPPGYRPSPVSPILSSNRRLTVAQSFDLRLSDLAAALQSRLTIQPRITVPSVVVTTPGTASTCTSTVWLRKTTVHTQVDYIHCLVPDLLDITRCAFYWGKMDRYEAERLLDGRPEGTFLLRDSAQDEYLFSVSFRRYGRSLHARVEQWNHSFSFDSHDPGVYSSTTVCDLLEHYKDPTSCMFFEPMLTVPLHRTFPFPLQHLCRAVIAGSRLTYDGVNDLQLPKPLRAYLKEYHYKQRVRVTILE